MESTVSVALADRLPAAFCAVQLYTPMSSVFTLAMKKMSSSGITCILRSRAAGKSVPPSFCHAICGAGWPSAAHSSLAMVPVRMFCTSASYSTSPSFRQAVAIGESLLLDATQLSVTLLPRMAT
ncbi:hypothetical protein EYF80_051646 [Liparis tanakae]|uniref:Uncharacterized protein n=1 Tax=Liparis tanakae TaxID=230148 RepID=A0A4Z2FAN4_9TELE|nr:hypothetical protein EYF80_051646 [Liparis tanakae]